nr:PREDICTED: uncharacterized protein LOC109041648 [Bemisia tabaci]
MAERALVGIMQREHFSAEIELLKKGKVGRHSLQILNPFLDEHGLIRVGGRLTNAPIAFDRKHPWVLPKNHHFIPVLVRHYHFINLHAGPQLLQSLLSQRFWIISARQAIRNVTRHCIPCFKTAPKNKIPLMGDLPSSRISESPPFYNTACDFAGPFSVKVHTLRFARTVKSYLCIFVCMVTKATHIEVTTDMTSDSFLAALVNFACRRGNPAHLYSDQGTNMMGGDHELKRIVKKLLSDLKDSPELAKVIQERQIQFHPSPPAAPHFNGLAEAAVKSAKKHLKTVIQDHLLTLEEFISVVNRVEAVLNSRPLVPISSDPNELTALTPAHFLIGRAVVTPAEPDYSQLPPNRFPAKRWKRVQAISQSFWKKWEIEYLNTLQNRRKWQVKAPCLKIDDLVLIHEHSTIPMHWRLGRVIQIFPGRDGQVRAALVRTANGELSRPAVKLYPLPINTE